MGRTFLLLAFLSLNAVAGYAQEMMPATSGGWAAFTARPAAAPVVFASGTGADYTLSIHGNNLPSVLGGWRTRISGLAGGQHYRFRARAVTAEIEVPRESLMIVLRWRGAFGD